MQTIGRRFSFVASIAVLASLALAAPAMAQARLAFPITPIPAELRPTEGVSVPMASAMTRAASPRSRGMTGAIVGGVVGAIAGGVIFHDFCADDGHSSCTGSTVGGAAMGAVVFGVLGGLIAGM